MINPCLKLQIWCHLLGIHYAKHVLIYGYLPSSIMTERIFCWCFYGYNPRWSTFTGDAEYKASCGWGFTSYLDSGRFWSKSRHFHMKSALRWGILWSILALSIKVVCAVLAAEPVTWYGTLFSKSIEWREMHHLHRTNGNADMDFLRSFEDLIFKEEKCRNG